MRLGVSASLGATATSGVEQPMLVTNSNSIVFDGTDEYIDTGIKQSTWSFNGGGTLVMWVKIDYSNGDNLFTNNYFHFKVQAGDSDRKILVQRYYSGGTADGYKKHQTEDDALADGVWKHVTLTWDTSSLSNDPIIYLNGVSVGVEETTAVDLSGGSPHAMTENWILGDDGSFTYKGHMDEVAIWDEILTATEIKAIYDNGKETDSSKQLDLSQDSVGYASSSNLKGWWRMGDEADTRVLDTNANNLIIPDMRKTFFTGKSIDFDGSNDYISISDSNDHTFGDGSSD